MNPWTKQSPKFSRCQFLSHVTQPTNTTSVMKEKVTISQICKRLCTEQTVLTLTNWASMDSGRTSLLCARKDKSTANTSSIGVDAISCVQCLWMLTCHKDGNKMRARCDHVPPSYCRRLCTNAIQSNWLSPSSQMILYSNVGLPGLELGWVSAPEGRSEMCYFGRHPPCTRNVTDLKYPVSELNAKRE